LVRNYVKKARIYPKGYGYQHVSWDNNDIVEDLGYTYGKAMGALRKSWLKLRICRSKSDDIGILEAQEQINTIQRAVGLDVTEWDNYDENAESEREPVEES
jgi:hypothetical protein